MKKQAQAPSKKSIVVLCLTPAGATPRQLITIAKERFDVDIPMPSMQRILQELKREGTAVKDGQGLWCLT